MYTQFSSNELRRKVVEHLQNCDHSYAQVTPDVPNYTFYQGLMTPNHDNLVSNREIAAAAAVIGAKIVI